jgi:hypothetical protein
MQTPTATSAATINDALGALLASEGFAQMAADVLTETDIDRLRKYARVIVKNAPEDRRATLANHFRTLRPALY